MLAFRKETDDTDRHLRSKRHEEEAKRIPSGRFLSECEGSFFAKRHRIEQIVLNGLTVYSFEGTRRKYRIILLSSVGRACGC